MDNTEQDPLVRVDMRENKKCLGGEKNDQVFRIGHDVQKLRGSH